MQWHYMFNIGFPRIILQDWNSGRKFFEDSFAVYVWAMESMASK